MNCFKNRCAITTAATGVGFAAGLASVQALAVDLEWTNPATSGTLFFDSPGNYSPSQSPTFADNVLFRIDQGGHPIFINSASQTRNLTVADNLWNFSGLASGTLTTTGFATIDDPSATGLGNGAVLQIIDGLVWTLSDPLTTVSNDNNLIVGDTGFGSLLVSGGSAVLAEQVFTGNQFGGVGEITVTGAGSTLTATRASNVGIHTIGNNGGTGTVNLIDGGQLLTTTTSGNDIWVGSGFFDADLADPLNAVTPSLGTLNISGTGSFAETDDLNIGIFGGTGFLNVSDGATVVLTDTTGGDINLGANDAVSGERSTGTAVIDGDGTLVNPRGITVGLAGDGTLTVSGGAEVRTQTMGGNLGVATIGVDAGSDGQAAVFGTASDGTTASRLDVDDTLNVGQAGLGELRIGQDLAGNNVGSGAVVVDVDLNVGQGVGNTLDNRVVVVGTDATLDVGNALNIGASGRGTLDASGGATLDIINGVAVGLFSGGDGTLLLDGSGTTLTAGTLFTGNGSGAGSVGVVTVSNGAVATFTDPADSSTDAVDAVTLGDDGAGVGTLNIIGPGSRVETTAATGGWFIGGSGNEQGGTGSVNISDSGVGISSGRVVLANGSANNSGSVGNLTINGDGSRFDANGDLVLVGFRGTGNVEVQDGGVLNANGIFVADAIGSAGSQLDIDGNGSTVNIGGLLLVGDSNRGTLNVTDGGRLNVATDNANQRLIIGDEGNADGSRLTVDGSDSRVDYFGNVDIAVGNAGGSTVNRATLEVLNGATFAAVQRDGGGAVTTEARIIIGDITNGNGLVRVEGAGSFLEAETIFVGDGPTGSSGILNIRDGGQVSLTDEFQAGSFGSGNGVVNVNDAGSRLDVGTTLSLGDDTLNPGGPNGASGTLNITQGATVTNGGQAYIGHFTGSFGTATLGSITGEVSSWSVGGELTLAGTETSSQTSGSGRLTINSGGLVDVASNVRIRNLGEVNLNGGELSFGGDLIFIDAGSTLNFSSGTLRSTNATGLSLSATLLDRIFNGGPQVLGTNQHLAIEGAALLGGALQLDGGELSIGNISAANFANVDFDSGTLNLTNAGLVVTAAGLLGNVAVVDDDETVNVTNSTFVQADGLLNVAGGNFSSGATGNSGTIVVAQGTADFGSLNNNDGDLVLIDAITTGTLTGGDITVVNTNAASALTLTSGSSIAFGLGTQAGDADLLALSGAADLAGSLIVSANDVSMLEAGDEFDLITASSVTDTFDSLVLPSLAGGLGLSVIYEATRVALAVIADAGLTGDYNGDGFVGQADLDLVLLNFGSNVLPTNFVASNLPDGAPFDGLIGQNELDGVLLNFGGSNAPNLSAIPEPSSLAMVMLAASGLLARRR